MAIDFGLGLRALQAYGDEATRDQQMMLNRQRAEQQQYAFNRERQQDQSRVRLAEQARGGDYAGARREAALGGDFDFATALGGLREDQLGQLQREMDTIGTLHPQLKALPPEQRAAVAAPILAQAGFTPEEIANNDWSDAGLDAQYQLSARGKAEIAARLKAQEARVVGDGGALVNGNGEVLYENQRSPKWQFDSESGSWLQEPGTGQNVAPPMASPQGGAGGPMSAMLAITAQTESGNRDYLPNGQLVTSPKGAQGAMQTMPGTQRDPGFGVMPARDGSVEEKNRVGRDYLAAMMQRYGGDAAKAWAAYNAGPGRVDQALQSRGENWLAAMPSETRAYVAKNIGQLGGGQGERPGVINVRAPKRKERDAPSGYEWNGDALRPIRGGPADPATATNRTVQSNRKAEGDLRSKFDAQPEVKTFKTARQQFNTLRDLANKPNPSGADDLAIIFNFMKTLDPASVVREGEFMQAANSAGFVEGVGNRFQRAKSGQWLNPQQRKEMVRTAYRNYKNYRDAYNQTAESYRGYARDYGVSADRVARTYTPDKPAKRAGRQISPTIRRIQ